MSRLVTLMLITVLVLSSLFMVGCAFAESIPKPSVPEFSVKLIDSSYYNVIEVKIKNQAITTYFDGSSNKTTQIFYSVRFKEHFSQDWAVIAGWNKEIPVSDPYVSNPYPEQDYGSEYTVLTFNEDIMCARELDFQVKAMIGQVDRVSDPSHSAIYNMYYAQAVFTGETSDSSETQTLIIGESQTPTPSPVTTPTPTITPYQEPQQIEQEVIIGAAITVAVLSAGLGLLLYLIKRK